MELANTTGQYNLSREAASRLLKVSIRTLDRYLKAKKLSTRVVDGRIWLDKVDLEGFMASRRLLDGVDRNTLSTPNLSTSFEVDEVDNLTTSSQDNVDFVTNDRLLKEEKFNYKILYSELKEELKEKQERLEIANYRVGQLEAQVRNSMPLLEYHRENYQRKQQEEKMNQKIQESQEVIQKLLQKSKYLKLSKKICIILLLIVLALQPLWLLLINFNNLF